MRLKALDRLQLCDGCGELYTYNAETSVTCPKTERGFCSLACHDAYDKHGNIVVFRCWGCAKELTDPAPAWELRMSGYMATFCSFECRDTRIIPRPRNQNWNCGQCNKPFVGAADIYRLPDGTGEYCSAACRDIAQGKSAWTKGQRVAASKQGSADALAERSGFIEFRDAYTTSWLVCVRAASVQYVRTGEGYGTEIGTPAGVVRVAETAIEVMAAVHRRLTLDALTDEGYFTPNG